MMKRHELINMLSTAADCVSAFLIIIKCFILFMPLTGIQIARQLLRERHSLRARITELRGEHQSEVWVLHIARQETSAYAKTFTTAERDVAVVRERL
jgi:hypothetical protein